jgi:hypothetical protein
MPHIEHSASITVKAVNICGPILILFVLYYLKKCIQLSLVSLGFYQNYIYIDSRRKRIISTDTINYITWLRWAETDRYSSCRRLAFNFVICMADSSAHLATEITRLPVRSQQHLRRYFTAFKSTPTATISPVSRGWSGYRNTLRKTQRNVSSRIGSVRCNVRQTTTTSTRIPYWYFVLIDTTWHRTLDWLA